MPNEGLKLNLRPPTRQDRLAAFFALYGIERGEVAAALGVSPQMLSKICKSDRAPARHLKAMQQMGFPAHLLPEPNSGNGRAAA